MRNAIAVGASLVIMAGLFGFTMMMARQQAALADAGVALPFSQRLAFAASDFVRAYWWIVFPVVLGACLLVAALFASNEKRT
jgi:type II secretory pathway component PulF